MLDQNDHHYEAQKQHSETSFNGPGRTEGYSAPADMAACRPGTTPRYRRCNPPLPGMEAYFPPEKDPPFELDNSSESLTTKLDNILQSSSHRDLGDLTWEQRQIVLDYEEAEGFGVGACINLYPSGEITAGCYSRGLKRAPGLHGKVMSMKFTAKARKQIKRAVESKITSFKLFLTLTFDPKLSVLTESGCVDQQWAKTKFKKFLNSLAKKYTRLADKTENDTWQLNYIWVAEIQEQNTQNIHFHILLDREFIDVKWLVKLWDQASNSVNIKRLNNQEHAVNYLLSYMKKGNTPIEGKRYGMSQKLLDGSKPTKFDFYGRSKRRAFLNIKDELEREIKENGGYVADWGLSLPAPCRPRVWKDKQGAIFRKPGVSQKIGKELLEKLQAAVSHIDQELGYGPVPDDLPF